MSILPRFAVLICLVFAFFQLGCEAASSTERLQLKFDELKQVSSDFHLQIEKVTDGESAKEMLPTLMETLDKVHEVTLEIGEAEKTSSRSAVLLKRELSEFKKSQKAIMRADYERLDGIPAVKTVLGKFLNRFSNL